MGETKFQPQEFPRTGSKADDIKEERKRRRAKVIDYNGQYLSPEQIFWSQTNFKCFRSLYKVKYKDLLERFDKA